MSQTLQERMTNLLNDTIAFYSVDPKGRRAEDGSGSCLYWASDGRRCAIGRLVTEEQARMLEDNFSGKTAAHVRPALPSELQALPVDFLLDIQRLHDSNVNWADKGLSSEGMTAVGQIRERIPLGIAYLEVVGW